MNLKDIQAEAQKDLKLDLGNLTVLSLRIPLLHNKYYKILLMELAIQRKIKRHYDMLYRNRWRYYLGKEDDEVYEAEPFDEKVLRQDVGMYLAADEKLQEAKEKLEFQKEKVDYVQSTIQQINNLQWQIKNTITWQQFTQGSA